MLGLTVNIGVLVYTLVNKELTIPQMLLSLYTLYIIFILTGLHYGNGFILSSYFWFISFFMIYQTVYPILIFYGGISYYGVTVYSVSYTLRFALRFLCIVMLSFYVILLVKKGIFNGLGLMKVGNKESGGIILIAIFNLIVELVGFIQSGLLGFISSGIKSRTAINSYISTTNIWGYVGYINIYLFVLFVIQYKVNKRSKGSLLVFANIATYLLVSIMTGSRKFVLWMLMICLMFYFAQIFTSKIPIIIGGVITIISSYQRIVVFDGGLYGDFFRRMAGLFGEFIFTTITFPLSYQLGIGGQMFNYPTYLDSILYFVPRSLFSAKNYSIAKVFMDYMDVGMGFASNPMLEGYVNCGDIGWLVEGIIISILLSIIMKYQKKNFYIFIFCIIFLVDLNRGEVSYFIRQLIEISITIRVLNRISKKIRI